MANINQTGRICRICLTGLDRLRQRTSSDDSYYKEIRKDNEMSEWLDIETAPRDGTWILLIGGRTDEDFYSDQYANESNRPVTARWFNEGQPDEDWGVSFWDGDWRTYYKNPTHWQPLPEPPKV